MSTRCDWFPRRFLDNVTRVFSRKILRIRVEIKSLRRNVWFTFERHVFCVCRATSTLDNLACSFWYGPFERIEAIKSAPLLAAQTWTITLSFESWLFPYAVKGHLKKHDKYLWAFWGCPWPLTIKDVSSVTLCDLSNVNYNGCNVCEANMHTLIDDNDDIYVYICIPTKLIEVCMGPFPTKHEWRLSTLIAMIESLLDCLSYL